MSESSQEPQNQTAFAAALQRAQQIAARINPGGVSNDRPAKRPSEDYLEPEVTKMARGSGSIPPNSFNNQNTRENFTPRGSVIMIPSSKVGLIIGKGGETIKQLQEKSGAKLFIVQDDPNSNEKPLHVSGDPNKVVIAKQLVQDILAGESNKNSDGKQEQQLYEYGRTLQIEVAVPKPAVGLVIGKAGEMIKRLQNETGAKIQFHQSKEEGFGERRCYVSGNHQNVEEARQRIEGIIASVCPGRNRNGDGEFTFTVPASKCGIIIGKGGETIKSIIQYSGVHCELDKSYKGEDRAFIIRGDEKQIEAAQKMISKKIHMQIDLVSTSVANNPQVAYPGPAMGYYQNWNTPGYELQQQQWGGAAGQTGQADYSLQWAEYFRNMGIQNVQASAPAASPAVPAGYSTSGPDYSEEWIEYYRKLGKHEEADAIENHLKVKNVR